MASSFERFERIARQSPAPATREAAEEGELHPFERRNIHQSFPPKVRELFDDGHYAEATAKAFAFVERTVQKASGLVTDTGWDLMMAAFEEKKGPLKLTPMSDGDEISEQVGYRFLFGGSTRAIRNPRAHNPLLVDDPDRCLDHLSFASLLLRRLEQAGYA
jgi:uncharacterized protein (TIGR02391 family)